MSPSSRKRTPGGERLSGRDGFFVVAATLFVRLLYLSQHAASPLFAIPSLDQRYYDLMARQIAGLSSLPAIDGFRPLLYPLFLSGIYRFAPENGPLFALLAQHAMGACMALMTAWLAARLFRDSRAGLAAGLLFALAGPPLFYEGLLLITTLFSFLLLLTWIVVFLAIESEESGRSRMPWFAAGVVLGMAAQARPNALPLALIFPLLGWFLRPEKPGARFCPRPLWAIPGVIVVQLLFAAGMQGYVGRFAPLAGAGGINLYLGNHAESDGMHPKQPRNAAFSETSRHDPFFVIAQEDYREATGVSGNVSPEVVSRYWVGRTADEIRKDPVRWTTLMFKKTWLMLWNHEVPNNRCYGLTAREEIPLLRLMPVRWILLLALLPWGTAALLDARRTAFLIWSATFFLLFSATVILFFVNSRFRIPLWPGMAILAGGGLLHLIRSARDAIARRTPRRRDLRLAGASLGLLLLSGINWFGIPPDPIENDLSQRANALCERGRFAEAEREARRCIEIAPNNSRYRFLLGNALLGEKHPEEAATAYLQAIENDPNVPSFHNNLAIALENAGRPAAAEMAYRRALELSPALEEARSNLSALRERQGSNAVPLSRVPRK